ncbi:transposase [Sulfitobacter sp. 1A13368]|uniref:transposase n=1 Tax=Sulfitobacter sp. 1A13368 TaxID=3368593 RepID=UPI003745201A
MLRIKAEDFDLQHWMRLNAHFPKGKVAEYFKTEEECEQHLFHTIWKLGYLCPRCDYEGDIWVQKTRRMYQCPNCRHQYTGRSVTDLYRKRASLLGCFKGAEWIIASMAGGKFSTQTIANFSKIVGLSYRPARKLRLEMFEELQKPMGGFWGTLLCDDVIDEYAYEGDRYTELLEYYEIDDPEDGLSKFRK